MFYDPENLTIAKLFDGPGEQLFQRELEPVLKNLDDGSVTDWAKPRKITVEIEFTPTAPTDSPNRMIHHRITVKPAKLVGMNSVSSHSHLVHHPGGQKTLNLHTGHQDDISTPLSDDTH